MQHEIGEFFENINDALKAVVIALGGNKVVGCKLRPELPIEGAKDFVKHCLDPTRREKFSPDQVLWLLRQARVVNFHSAMDFMSQDVGYNRPVPIDLDKQIEEEEDVLGKELARFNSSVERIEKMRQRRDQERAGKS